MNRIEVEYVGSNLVEIAKNAATATFIGIVGVGGGILAGIGGAKAMELAVTDQPGGSEWFDNMLEAASAGVAGGAVFSTTILMAGYCRWKNMTGYDHSNAGL